MSESMNAADGGRNRLVLAQASCLCLGLSMMLWGLAPAIVERMLTQHAPSPEAFLMGAAALLSGAVFIGLSFGARNGTRWALWLAFVGSLLIATATVIGMIVAPTPWPSLFAPILAGLTTVATWLSLAQGREPRQPQRN